MGPRVAFSGIKEKFFDSSTVVYICLHSSSNSSTLVYIHLWLAYTRLVTRLCFRIYPKFGQEVEIKWSTS